MKDRDDSLALPAVLAKLKSDSPAVQLAAIDAVGALGNGSSVPTLLSVAKGEVADAALDSLVALQGADVNAALIKAAESPETSALAVKALGKRRVKEAVDLFFQLSKSDSAAVAQEATVALGRTVSEDRFSELLALLKTAKSDSQKAAAQEAVHSAIIRSTQPDVCAETLGAMIPAHGVGPIANIYSSRFEPREEQEPLPVCENSPPDRTKPFKTPRRRHLVVGCPPTRGRFFWKLQMVRENSPIVHWVGTSAFFVSSSCRKQKGLPWPPRPSMWQVGPTNATPRLTQ